MAEAMNYMQLEDVVMTPEKNLRIDLMHLE